MTSKQSAEISASNKPKGEVGWCWDKAGLKVLLEHIDYAVAVSLDLETTGLDEHAVTGGRSSDGVGARAVMAMLTVPLEDQRPGHAGEWDGQPPRTFVIPLSHPKSPLSGHWRKVLAVIWTHLRKRKTRLIGHNLKYDLRYAHALTGIDLSAQLYWDTSLSAHLLDENLPVALKEVASRDLGVPRWDDIDLTYPGAAEDVDLFVLGDYGARDTWFTWEVYLAHVRQMFLDPGDDAEPLDAEEVADARLGDVMNLVAIPTAKSLTRMEERGIVLDVEGTRSARDERSLIVEVALDEICTEYDMPREQASMAATSGWFKELANRGIERGELAVTALTPSGSPQWSKTVLKKQARQGSRLAELILEARGNIKEVEFLNSWLDKVTPQGTIHSTYRAGHVATGRLSSTGPNLQQVTKSLRPMFIPRPGFVMADLDYSQLELRVIAFISQSEPMMEAYRNGADLHTMVVAQTLGKPPEEVLPEERQLGKAQNFGLAYGAGVEGFQSYAEDVYGVAMTSEEALSAYNGYFSTWEGLAQWQEKTKSDAYRNGYVVSPIGRRRLLPDIRDGNGFMRGKAERMALNAPVQGFGSDLMQIGIASILGLMPGSRAVEGAYPVATVHDSVVVEVREENWQEIVEECAERMVTPHRYLEKMGCDLTVPLEADYICGTRWSLDDVSNPRKD